MDQDTELSLSERISIFNNATKVREVEERPRLQQLVRNLSDEEWARIAIRNPSTGEYEVLLRYMDSLVSTYYNYYLGIPTEVYTTNDPRQWIKYWICVALNDFANEYREIYWPAKDRLKANAERTVPMVFAFILLVTLNDKKDKEIAIKFLSEIYSYVVPKNFYIRKAQSLLKIYRSKQTNTIKMGKTGDIYAYLFYCWENYYHGNTDKGVNWAEHRDKDKKYPIAIAGTRCSIGEKIEDKNRDIRTLKSHIIKYKDIKFVH